MWIVTQWGGVISTIFLDKAFAVTAVQGMASPCEHGLVASFVWVAFLENVGQIYGPTGANQQPHNFNQLNHVHKVMPDIVYLIQKLRVY